MATEEFDPSKDSTLVNGLRLWRHIVEKGFQFGSVVGLAIVLPIVAYREKKQGVSLQAAAPKLARAQVIAAASGLALSSVMGAMRTAGYEDKKAAFEDRAYRLHYNKGQTRADTFAHAGMALGGAGAALALGPTAAVVAGGASVGAALGLLGHVATNRPAEKEPNKMVYEM